MPVKIDYVLEDASAFNQAVNNHMDVISISGDGQKKQANLATCISNLVSLNTAQIKSENFVEQKTAEQNALMQNSDDLITEIQNAAKSASKDKTNDISLKVFKVGTDKPNSVKGMTSWLDYFSDVVVQYHDILAANGMTENDIAGVHTLYVSLVASNAAQENAKKLRNAATARRNDAATTLQQTVAGMRNYVKNVFKGDSSTLEEFKKPIPKGRGKVATPAPAPASAIAQK